MALGVKTFCQKHRIDLKEFERILGCMESDLRDEVDLQFRGYFGMRQVIKGTDTPRGKATNRKSVHFRPYQRWRSL